MNLYAVDDSHKYVQITCTLHLIIHPSFWLPDNRVICMQVMLQVIRTHQRQLVHTIVFYRLSSSLTIAAAVYMYMTH